MIDATNLDLDLAPYVTEAAKRLAVAEAHHKATQQGEEPRCDIDYDLPWPYQKQEIQQ